MQTVLFNDLGKINYQDAWNLQEQLFNAVVQTKIKNRELTDENKIPHQHHFLLCEHSPVITLGKNADAENILINEHFLKQHNIQKFNINRGGDVTFHGPGQIVGYPILDLDYFFTDIGKYLRCIEEIIIRTLAAYDIKGERLPGVTGVWLDPQNKLKARKICAIGIRCSRWVTMHGFAFNVNTDLNYFNYIIPCGINDKAVTSLQKELGRETDIDEVKEIILQHFEEVFECKFQNVAIH
ncbi:MAG: lipoyl(octanoyl) transferase LipB [Fimbriimonadaceae bacterium]|nr:lipoyl(octanoyl) transferase LipB [Chitinophagales bacterium]